MEQDAKESSGITRSQHSVLVLPHDRSAVSAFLGTAVDRVDANVADTQLLVVTPDADTTALVSGVASDLTASGEVGVVPVTSVKRAIRMLGERRAQVVVGGAEEIVALIQGSSLKLGALRAIVLAWADETAAPGSATGVALETIMAEVPKESARVLVTARLGQQARELAERYARRGLRAIEAAADDEAGPVSIQYVVVSPTNRGAALRRLLDELDPARAVVWTRTAESEADASRAIGALGYRGAGASVRVVRGAPLGEAGLAVLYDVPADRAELLAALGGAPSAPQIVALAQPRQVELVRALASGGRVGPLTLGGPAAAARRREESVRAELRTVLESGLAARELLALEPLLESYDGIEIAAAALRLLDQSRSSAAQVVAESPRSGVAIARGAGDGGARPVIGGEPVKIFLTIGERDGVRAGDLVGAIAGTAGIPGTSVGRVEIRDTHSLVEIVGEDAEAVATKITGISIKGRRVVARLERERPPREGGAGGARGYGGREGGREGARGRPSGGRSSGDRPASPRSRGDRPDRGGERGFRSERPPRRDDAGARGGFRSERPRDRDDRPRRPREERGDR
ncbi:MAG: DbpA RNA binding domain-containing protein [Gemmatimonadaceae bacterium]